MAHVVVLGAGLGGTIMAYELRDKLSRDDEVTVINLGDTYSFVPSNPWVAVGWRAREDVEVDLKPVFNKRHITLRPEGAARSTPKKIMWC
ncbi:FAD/NAD(P)-binding oxidoreductase [Vibrio sp. PP-XX7]